MEGQGTGKNGRKRGSSQGKVKKIQGKKGRKDRKGRGQEREKKVKRKGMCRRIEEWEEKE